MEDLISKIRPLIPVTPAPTANVTSVIQSPDPVLTVLPTSIMNFTQENVSVLLTILPLMSLAFIAPMEVQGALTVPMMMELRGLFPTTAPSLPV